MAMSVTSLKGSELVELAQSSTDKDTIAKVQAELERRKTNREAKIAAYAAEGRKTIGQEGMRKRIVDNLKTVKAHLDALTEADDEVVAPVMAFHDLKLAKMKKAELVALAEALIAAQ